MRAAELGVNGAVAGRVDLGILGCMCVLANLRQGQRAPKSRAVTGAEECSQIKELTRAMRCAGSNI